MRKNICLGIFCIGTLLSYSSFALENNVIPLKIITVDYDLPPNQPQVFSNYMFWTIEANCKMTIEGDSTNFFLAALAKKGKINDLPIVAGQSLQLTIRANENLKIIAESGAKVEITNLGPQMAKASCSA